MATSMMPRLPGAWLIVPSSVAVRKMTNTVAKSTAGLGGSGDCRLGQVSSAAAGRCQWRPARIQLVRGWEGGPQVGCVMYGQPAKNFLSLNVQSRDCYLALVVVRHGLMGSRHR